MELIEKASKVMIAMIVGISLTLIMWNGLILGGFKVLD